MSEQLTFQDAVGKYQRAGQASTSRESAVAATPLTGTTRTAPRFRPRRRVARRSALAVSANAPTCTYSCGA